MEAAEELIHANANFKIRLNSGFTPFLDAVREGHQPMVQFLLKAGADVNDKLVSPPGDPG